MSQKVLRDNGVIEEILQKHSSMVYRIAYLRTGSVHDAEDIMQDVFVRFIKSKPFFESAEHEKSWFIRATLNRTNSFFTSAWRRKTVALDERTSGTSDESYSYVFDAVEKLPADIKTAIHLYYCEDMPVKDISSVMGKSESAVKSLLFRGRKLLKIELADDT